LKQSCSLKKGHNMNRPTISMLFTVLVATATAPAHAFLDEMVIGMTSVANNLISSSTSVTNNTVNQASATLNSLSSNPGKMADRIGLMADRIGLMADRIVTTEGLMAGVAHKLIDSNQQSRLAQQPVVYSPAVSHPFGQWNAGTSGVNVARPAPTAVSNPYMNAYAPVAQQQEVTAYRDNSHYSASNMIFGHAGSTYTAARHVPAQPATPVSSGFGFSVQPAVKAANRSCGLSYGVPVRC
jgi:hypothetical protein